ncbi:MAG: hypothetical protein J5875_04475 [Paludibacteraceae bacterium]|nr:hypothetical protein [Paludibacteraceae bacterium]
MKKKLLALFSTALLVFVGFNNVACSDDDDDENGEITKIDTADIKTAFEQGSADGKAYAEAYESVKENGVTSVNGMSSMTKMINYGKKYKKNESKSYKAGFLAAANGIGDAETVEELLGSSSVSALSTLLEAIFSKDE